MICRDFLGPTSKILGKNQQPTMKSVFKVLFEVEIEFDETEISEQSAMAEVISDMYFPCEDTDSVTIIRQTVIATTKNEAKKPFVRLTISNWRANKKFQEATNLHPTHQFDGFFDYDDLDMHDDMATVIRTLGQLDSSSYYFTTERP